MNQSLFNIRIGDNITFLGPTDSCFIYKEKYRILAINNFGEYPFNEAHLNDLVKDLNNPRVLTIKDKNTKTFTLIYTDDGFYHDDEPNWSYRCNFDTFTIERKLRKEKLEQINGKNT